MINLVTVCTAEYSMTYANKFPHQFRNLSEIAISYCVITKRPNELPDVFSQLLYCKSPRAVGIN